jgi:hypothetical protein
MLSFIEELLQSEKCSYFGLFLAVLEEEKGDKNEAF